MKSYKILMSLLVVAGLCFSSCDDDDFLTNNGGTNVTTVAASFSPESVFYYDLADQALADLTVDQGNEASFSSATAQKRISGAGAWVDHANLTSFPSTVSLSLLEVLDGTGLGLEDVGPGDDVDISFIANENRGGNVSLPIQCSTNISIGEPSFPVFLLDDGESGEISFDASIDGPAPVETVTIVKRYDGGEWFDHATLDADDFPTTLTIQLGDVIDGILDADENQIEYDGDAMAGKNFDIGFVLTSAVDCFSESIASFPLACPSEIPSGMYEAVSSGVSGGGNGDFGPITEIVNITFAGGISYDLDDVSFGMYEQFWGGGEDPGHFIDVCGSLELGPDPDQWDDIVTGTGAYDSETGQITFEWSNGYGDAGSVVLTPM